MLQIRCYYFLRRSEHCLHSERRELHSLTGERMDLGNERRWTTLQAHDNNSSHQFNARILGPTRTIVFPRDDRRLRRFGVQFIIISWKHLMRWLPFPSHYNEIFDSDICFCFDHMSVHSAQTLLFGDLMEFQLSVGPFEPWLPIQMRLYSMPLILSKPKR